MDDILMTKGFYNSKSKFIDYVSIFLLIYFPSSFWGIAMKGVINLSLLLAVSFITLIINNRKLRIYKKSFMFVLSIIILSSFTMFMNQDSPYQYLIFWASLVSAYFMFLSFDLFKFIYIFTKTMHFICLFSLVTFAILLTVPGVLSVFPTITNATGLTVNNLVFTVVYNSTYINSNFGLFWEPGVFQTFINLALYFQLFVLKDLNIRRIIVFMITIFTTFSTTGYLSAFLLFAIYLITNNEKAKSTKRKRRKLLSVVIILMIVGAISFSMLPSNINFKVFGKLEAIVNPNLTSHNIAYRSTTARMDAIKIPIINFVKSPLWGRGFKNLYNYTISSNTNFLTATPLNWFGLFGALLGFLMNYSLWKFTKFSNSSILIRILEFAFLNLIILSEYYNMNAFILTIIIFGFANREVLNRDEQFIRKI
jgi:hypothetical protein